MTLKKTIQAAILLAAGAMPAVGGEAFRTDINPAQLYYQAFLVAPDLEQDDRNFLWTDWRGQKLPDRFGKLVGKYDGQLALARQAAHCTVPCDWGIDFSAGPATLLPHLARAKAVTQNARLRAAWALQQGRPEEACDDLLAALALGRNISRDGTLVSVLVQIAIEALVCYPLAENFHQFPAETLKRFIEGLDAAPARGTVAACLPTEKRHFHDWTLRKILELQKQNPGNDAKAMAGIRQLFFNPEDREPDAQNNYWKRVVEAAGGTSEGMIKLFHQSEQLDERMAALSALPYSEFESQLKEFSTQFEKSPNPFIASSFRSIGSSRMREFRMMAELAMVRAAVENKLRGEAGLKTVSDPCGKGPFTFRRFVLDGVDRGFELKSEYNMDGSPFLLIFVEKDGPPFLVEGRNVGQSVKKVQESDQEAFRRRYGLESGKK